ncbi:MAG TPA: lysophospholipid acyltransferase family protein [Bacteroidia bacterium]|nr:lysophospholipid acyltransferase family protein [Bacteroidia bacterium]
MRVHQNRQLLATFVLLFQFRVIKKAGKYLLFPLQWIWRSLFFINAVLTFFIFFPVFYVLLRSRKWFGLVFRIKKIWAHCILWPVFIFYKIEKKSELDKNKAYVFCPNHTSYLDIMLIYISIPAYFHTMGKAELRRVPLFRHFFDRMNIPVNRKSRVDSHRAFIRACNDIDKKISITLFPEGTIHHNGPVMGRFKNGPFRLAIEKQVPIVPITFMNNWLLLPDDYFNRVGYPGIAHVIMHEPIETEGLTEADLETLKARVYEVIDAPLRAKYASWFSKSPQ